MKALTFLFLGATVLTGTLAYGECESGQLTTLVALTEVFRKDAKNGLTQFTLSANTEVHVVGIKDGEIQIYAMKNLNGKSIDGLGKVSQAADKKLACQL
ncbi:MAG: hypothetical protein AB7N80_09590 [Bdellovibrionales bacterium]